MKHEKRDEQFEPAGLTVQFCAVDSCKCDGRCLAKSHDPASDRVFCNESISEQQARGDKSYNRRYKYHGHREKRMDLEE